MDNKNIIFEIGKYLEEINLINLQRINKMFYEVFNDNFLWKKFGYLNNFNFKGIDQKKNTYFKFKKLEILFEEWSDKIWNLNKKLKKSDFYYDFDGSPRIEHYYEKHHFIKTIYECQIIEFTINTNLIFIHQNISELDNLTILDLRCNNLENLPLEIINLRNFLSNYLKW